MPDFHYHVRPRVWIGPDALLRLPLLADELTGPGKARALLVIDPLLYESKAVDRVRGLLEERGFQVLVYDEIPDRATSVAADDALRLARGAKAPLVISMGGLRTLMIGRAAAVAAPSRLDIDAVLDGSEIRVPPLPSIEIPTSYRHPLMTTDCIALPDGRDRRPRFARVPMASPQAVLIDPSLSSSLSHKIAATCVIDALLGAVEAYVSSKANFMSDLVLEKATTILATALDGLISRP
ncbi:MAG: iron-containing alcohol dehydrogenase, partial [Spirochaetaceae bacterium]|nr:iron-containing alcohol dehydrogenase [Spirochaetaceae bacterium]